MCEACEHGWHIWCSEVVAGEDVCECEVCEVVLDLVGREGAKAYLRRRAWGDEMEVAE